MATDGDRLTRFSFGERLLHWLTAAAFLVMLATGVALYLPSLADVVPRPEAKAWHLDAALALGIGVVLIAIGPDRLRLRRTLHDLDRFEQDDIDWLKGGPRRLVNHETAPPQGRFNAGQKLNAALLGGLMVVLAVSGVLLWQGEQDTAYRFAGSVVVHDWASILATLLVLGHVYLAAVHPSTRHALRGMVSGWVRRDWALAHHRRWVEELDAGRRTRSGEDVALHDLDVHAGLDGAHAGDRVHAVEDLPQP